MRLADICNQMQLSHATIVMTLAREADPFLVELTCDLLKKPIYLCARGETGFPETDFLGRPLPMPIGHRRGEPLSVGAPVIIVRRTMTRTLKQDPRVFIYVASPNPKQPGTAAHKRFALYQEGMTVTHYLALGGRPQDIKYDLGRGYIQLRLP